MNKKSQDQYTLSFPEVLETSETCNLYSMKRKNPYPTFNGFSLRVANARRSLRRLGSDGFADIHTRGFDSCFEKFDGDAVVWALIDHAVKGDTVLEIGIKRLSSGNHVWNNWLKIYHS